MKLLLLSLIIDDNDLVLDVDFDIDFDVNIDVYKLSEPQSEDVDEYKASPKYTASEKSYYESESIPVYKPKRTQRMRRSRKPKRNTFRRMFGFK